MKMKKSVLGFSAKFALLVMVVCSSVLTGCYDKVAPTPVTPPAAPEYFISGTVVDDATNQVIPDFDITITPAQTGSITKSNGTFSAKLPSSGSYTVKVVASGYGEFTSIVNISEITTGAYTANLAVRLKSSDPGVDPTPSYYITGTVLDKKTNQPIEGLTINAVTKADPSVTINADGTFKIKVDTFGTYELTFSAPKYKNCVRTVILEEGKPYGTVTVSLSIIMEEEGSDSHDSHDGHDGHDGHGNAGGGAGGNA